jgi:hypothetical protein
MQIKSQNSILTTYTLVCIKTQVEWCNGFFSAKGLMECEIEPPPGYRLFRGFKNNIQQKQKSTSYIFNGTKSCKSLIINW